MIVVSDTSPLNYLILIGAIDTLPAIFGEIHLPHAVLQELSSPSAPPQVHAWIRALPPWTILHAPIPLLSAPIPLDAGEAEAIALATHLHAGAILLDERKGRRVAIEHGLQPIGTITVLELAAARNLLDLRDALNALQRTTFRISQQLINDALTRASRRNP